ncbi:hypothetical protein B5X24_HaOG213478 [Helicoverpa armigera]|uniref:Uncharacterized protein n=1 Tax=Helicoverpa armigera TaxID=29058 RepID=A0A2W1BB45_HELAM|nr:hypothetical protein B5X24_HaOG213478 [Helicoverpa armigera]
MRVDLTLSTCHSKKIPFRARTTPRLHLSPQSISTDDIADCKHLFDLADQLTYNAGTPKIIIGQDNWHLLLVTDIRRGSQHQPIVSVTPLGGVLHGARTGTLGEQEHYVNQLNNGEENIDKQLREYFALESLIINPCRPASDPEKRAEDILQRSIVQLQDGRAANIIDIVPDPVRFSKWERLLRATARVLQFISWCRTQRTEKTFYKRTRKNQENDPDWSKAVRATRTPGITARAKKDAREYIALDAIYIL